MYIETEVFKMCNNIESHELIRNNRQNKSKNYILRTIKHCREKLEVNKWRKAILMGYLVFPLGLLFLLVPVDAQHPTTSGSRVFADVI